MTFATLKIIEELLTNTDSLHSITAKTLQYYLK